MYSEMMPMFEVYIHAVTISCGFCLVCGFIVWGIFMLVDFIREVTDDKADKE